MTDREVIEKLVKALNEHYVAASHGPNARKTYHAVIDAKEEAEQYLSAPSVKWEGPDRCPTCNKVYLKHDGFLWCPTCQTEEQDRKQFKAGFELGQRVSPMTPQEALEDLYETLMIAENFEPWVGAGCMLFEGIDPNEDYKNRLIKLREKYPVAILIKDEGHHLGNTAQADKGEK